MRKGAIILCGGKSSRMGRDKAMLPFGPELMLQRVARLVTEVVEPANIVVVAAPEQELPGLRAGIEIARDALAHRGPLQGLATGLSAIGGRVEAVFAVGCDAPLKAPAFIRRMFELLGDFVIVSPFDGDHDQSRAAVYRPGVLSQAEAVLNSGHFSPRSLFDTVRTRMVHIDTLRAVDPNLDTLKNLNHEYDYLTALASAGFTPSALATGNETPGRAE
jgi:molybdopterin-guanine dinucleotide biosynthesis protein A